MLTQIICGNRKIILSRANFSYDPDYGRDSINIKTGYTRLKNENKQARDGIEQQAQAAIGRRGRPVDIIIADIIHAGRGGGQTHVHGDVEHGLDGIVQPVVMFARRDVRTERDDARNGNNHVEHRLATDRRNHRGYKETGR